MPEGLIDWPGLMRAGLGGLRLSPEAFWSMTPRELSAALNAPGLAAPMSRDRLRALERRFPDTRPCDESP